MLDSVTFTRVDDSEGNENRGWQIDRVDAIFDGVVIGYLKISYIPRARFKQFYPSIFNYMAQIAGRCGIFDPEAEYIRYQDLSDANLAQMLTNAYSYPFPKYDHLTGQALQDAARDLEQRFLNGEMGKRFREFQRSHVNKPMVEYILIFDSQYLRKGIGRALYLEGARWMAEKQMRLYASDLQSDEAQQAWAGLARLGYVGGLKNRYIKLQNAA